jgi:hypothetical protein
VQFRDYRGLTKIGMHFVPDWVMDPAWRSS